MEAYREAQRIKWLQARAREAESMKEPAEESSKELAEESLKEPVEESLKEPAEEPLKEPALTDPSPISDVPCTKDLFPPENPLWLKRVNCGLLGLNHEALLEDLLAEHVAGYAGFIPFEPDLHEVVPGVFASRKPFYLEGELEVWFGMERVDTIQRAKDWQEWWCEEAEDYVFHRSQRGGWNQKKFAAYSKQGDVNLGSLKDDYRRKKAYMAYLVTSPVMGRFELKDDMQPWVERYKHVLLVGPMYAGVGENEVRSWPAVERTDKTHEEFCSETFEASNAGINPKFFKSHQQYRSAMLLLTAFSAKVMEEYFDKTWVYLKSGIMINLFIHKCVRVIARFADNDTEADQTDDLRLAFDPRVAIQRFVYDLGAKPTREEQFENESEWEEQLEGIQCLEPPPYLRVPISVAKEVFLEDPLKHHETVSLYRSAVSKPSFGAMRKMSFFGYTWTYEVPLLETLKITSASHWRSSDPPKGFPLKSPIIQRSEGVGIPGMEQLFDRLQIELSTVE